MTVIGDWLLWILVCIYVLAMLFIAFYALAQAHLLFHYKKSTIKADQRHGDEPITNPIVTIQLPIYNERYVVERLIDAVCQMDYPRDKLHIQVLDDSTDDCTFITEQQVALWRAKGMDIDHIQRPNRVGFKAGALKYGLSLAKGDLIAIFDADFLPDTQFLKQTIAFFEDPEIGMVQTRWAHINRNDSMITQVQAMALDGHFAIEQTGRNRAGAFINFNGTAGVWRKQCILDAGNWEADTLTEDLDLSYRAQLKGWKFKYLESVESPAELPPVMSAVKSQQYRWNKGGAEVARKSIGKLLRSSMPFHVKLHGTLHLLNSSVFLAILTAGIVSVPLVYILGYLPQFTHILNYGTAFILVTIVIAINYFIAYSKYADKPTVSFIWMFPVFLCMSMGLALHNGIAVFEGFMGRKTPFVRTPKLGDSRWHQNQYLLRALPYTTYIEALLGIYFIVGMGIGLYFSIYGLVIFHGMLAIGFITIVFLTVWHTRTMRLSPHLNT